MEVATLLTAARTYNSLVTFIENGGLYDGIKAVGDHAIEAALYALETKDVSSDPESRVRSAVTHLELAHVAYRSVWLSRKNNLGKRLRSVSLAVARNKDVWVLCLMAACYRYLSDPKAAKKVLADAKSALEVKAYDWADYEKMTNYFSIGPEIQGLRFFGTAVLHMINPQELNALWSHFKSDAPEVSPDDLQELDRLLAAIRKAKAKKQ